VSLRAFARPLLWQAVAWLLVALIVVLSLSPPLNLQQWSAPSWNDKVGHFLAYFTLAAWYAELCGSASAMRRRLLFCVLLGAALELLQGLTPARSPDWRDLVANIAGALAGAALWFTPAAQWLQRWDRQPT
jgi:VanZ family protein